MTLCAAATPPFAERASKTGQPAKAAMLWLFFGLAVAFSLTSSIARSSGYADTKVAGAEQIAKQARLANEAYAAAQEIQAAECTKRGPKCRAAEVAVAEARERLAAVASAQAADPGAKRLATVLGIDEATVQLYAPLLLPLGLELGGFIFLAAGLAPRRREPELQPAAATCIATQDVAKPVAVDVAIAAKRGTKAYYLQRLEAEHPAAAKRVAAGEFSVYAACVAVGLRKPPKASAKWTSVDAYVQPTDATA